VAAAAGSAAEVIELAARLRPDVVLLDLELPEQGGLAALPALAQAHAGAKVLIFTAYGSDERVLGAFRAGARGYLLKGAPVAEIVRAIRAVHAGGCALSPDVARALVAEACCPGGGRPTLTPREREVLRGVADGLSNKQVARALGITERTVKFHVSSLLTRLGAETRAQAVRIALEQELL
jgi:DNA-binding NarL/FixJ family response regulator